MLVVRLRWICRCEETGIFYLWFLFLMEGGIIFFETGFLYLVLLIANFCLGMFIFIASMGWTMDAIQVGVLRGTANA